MSLKGAVLKALPIVVAACFAGGAIAAGTENSPRAEKPKVDCQKNPTHPDCKKAK